MEATLFMMNFQNQLISGSLAGGDETELTNGGATRHLGGEVSLAVKIGKAAKWGFDLDVTGQYTYSRATFTGNADAPQPPGQLRFIGNFLPYSPQHSASAILDFDHPFGAGAQLAWNFVGDQFTDDANSVSPDTTGRVGLIPAYSTIDLGLRYAHKRSGLTFSLAIKNLLDQVVIVSRRPDGIFTGGFRQITGGVRWEYPAP